MSSFTRATARDSTDATREPDDNSQERTRLIRDGFVNYSSTVISGALGLVLVPVMIHHVGARDYGIWVAAIAVASLVGILDASLAWVVTRHASGRAKDAPRVLGALWTIYFALGLTGLVVMTSVGFVLSSDLHLARSQIGVSQAVFALIGAAFVTDQITAYTSAALAGMRRFVLLNLAVVVGALVRVGGALILLESGAKLIVVAAWQLASSVAAAAVMTAALARAQPLYLPRLPRMSGLRSLRPHLGFGVHSLAATAASGIILQVPSVLIGVLKGPLQLTAYNVGQKFPLVASMLVWQAGEVVFPAVSESGAEEPGRMRRAVLLLASFRSVLVLAVPLCVIGASLSRPLLDAWLGHADPKSVSIMRLAIATLAVDAAGIPAMLVLWGAGAVRRVAVILGWFALLLVGAGSLLIYESGIVAMAWIILALTAATSLEFGRSACRLVDLSPRSLLKEARGLILPAGLCAGVALSVEYLGLPHRWPQVAATAALALLVYGWAFLARGATAAERRLAVQLVPFRSARSAYAFTLVLIATLRERQGRVDAELEREYKVEDPWHYRSTLGERRFARELALIDSVGNDRGFARVLEIGCGEGLFTERLALRCRSLVAVDINDVALARTRRRCAHLSQVTVRRWDLRQDDTLGQFDLVVATSVLEYIRTPGALRRARSKLARSVGAGGWLLVGNFQQHDIIEQAMWDRYLLRGARHVNAFVARHPDFKIVAESQGDGYLELLLAKPSQE